MWSSHQQAAPGDTVNLICNVANPSSPGLDLSLSVGGRVAARRSDTKQLRHSLQVQGRQGVEVECQARQGYSLLATANKTLAVAGLQPTAVPDLGVARSSHHSSGCQQVGSYSW